MATFNLPPPPTQEPDKNTYVWVNWFQALYDWLTKVGRLAWTVIDFTSSNITDIETRNHNDLQNIQGGTTSERYHLTSAQHTALTGLGTDGEIVYTDASGNLASEPAFHYDATNNVQYVDKLVLSKANTGGIKVEDGDETYPWHDLLGAISIRGVGATDPAYNVYRGGIRGYQFAVNDEVFIEFHMPHDWAFGTDLHLHMHWSQNKTTKAGAASGNVTGGTVTWGAEVSYAKGHQQAAFAAPITFTVQQTAETTQYYHHIAEGQLSAGTPSASQLDTDNLEVDGVLLVRIYLSANAMTVDAGAVPAPFLHFADIHYQSTCIGTKDKAPDFYA